MSEWVCRIPSHMADDPEEWQDFWRASVLMGGQRPVGVPTLERRDEALVNGERLFPEHPAGPLFIARGAVEPRT